MVYCGRTAEKREKREELSKREMDGTNGKEVEMDRKGCIM